MFDWPQLCVIGELIGGCDIASELVSSGAFAGHHT